MYQRLQPYVPEATTLCTRGCNPMSQRLQPYVPEAAILCPRRPRSSLTSLCQAVGVSSATPLAAAALAMPAPLAMPSLATPPESRLAAPPVEPDWFVGLTPLQRAPRTATALGQLVSVLGQPNGAAAAAMAAALLPCRGGYAAGGGALWARAQPLLLPLSFPQFFAASLGRHGQACHGHP